MLAVLIYFRRDLWRIGETWLRSLRDRRLRGDHDARLGWYIVLGTVPIAVFGLAFKDQIETGARDLYLIGAALIVVGLVLLLAERVGARTRRMEEIDTRDGVAIGLAQALALVPGVSRSGATIAAGLFRGLERTAAARFSFLLSVPAVVLSGLFELAKLVRGEDGESTTALGLVLATLLAFVVGYASIAFLLRFLVTHSTKVFVAYRVVLGTVVLVLVGAGAIR
jgi:undecaprenyl-diphosphatase